MFIMAFRLQIGNQSGKQEQATVGMTVGLAAQHIILIFSGLIICQMEQELWRSLDLPCSSNEGEFGEINDVCGGALRNAVLKFVRTVFR